MRFGKCESYGWRAQKTTADEIARRASVAINEERFSDARVALYALQEYAGDNWPELIRLRSLMAFAEGDKEPPSVKHIKCKGWIRGAETLTVWDAHLGDQRGCPDGFLSREN